MGDEEQIRLHHLDGAAELRAQLRLLAGDPDRAAVEMTGAHHQAALSEQQRGAERDLVGAEQGGDHDVASCLQPAVDA